MLQVTKIIRFETAHAIHGYEGKCRNIHGHSYVLHVSVSLREDFGFLPAPGFILDFKDLKQIANRAITSIFDHRVVVSEAFVKEHAAVRELENIVIWTTEPTAENMVLYIRDRLQHELPGQVMLKRLVLYETSDSYATWEAE